MKKIIKRAVVLTLLVALLVPATVFAAEDTVAVSGDVEAILTLTVPGPIALGNLPVGATTGSDDQSITVGTNNPGGFTLTVRDSNQVGANIGRMVSGANVLFNPLEVKGGDTTTYTPLTVVETTTVLVKATTTAAEDVTINDFSVQQQVLWDDPVAIGYSITLYFIAMDNA